MNDETVYRTAPATPGLLNIRSVWMIGYEWVIIVIVLYIKVKLCVLNNVNSCRGRSRHIVLCWGILCFVLVYIHFYIINRPGVAGAVLQSPPSFIHSFIM